MMYYFISRTSLSRFIVGSDLVAKLFLANRPLLFVFVLSPQEFSSLFRCQALWSAGRESIKQLEILVTTVTF